ncbi:hypothetical protein [Paraburkholderia tagetis]|uniref:Phage-related protein n=1 Tax=Paraburkholderia tagetis TaxID=2913261 RepID=A0A9X2A1I2_9BURK|nr:hypothetical protein [Paraburkholderia tagetis]MCG5078680.1 hypothetical protein [Paraburkholderia tagetis]
MNRLHPPEIDDNEALTKLANNKRVRSFPHLLAELAPIIAGYEQYRAVLGDAHQIANVPLSDEVRGYLKGHYSSPPADLSYIRNLRLDAEQRVCPMCGSMHRGTLDHLMPKEAYTAFAVFSLNLVPACKCNTLRGEVIVGPSAGQRILHPYFDECLSERLIAARFDDLGAIPRISIQLLTPLAHPQHRAIEFHVREIVSNTAILKHLSDRWTHLCDRPQRIVRALAEIPQSEQALREILEKERELTDETRGGKNNWDSVFVTGLLDADVLHWLYLQLSRPGRGPDAPLVVP